MSQLTMLSPDDLPPRTTSAPQIRHEGNALIIGQPGNWRITSERDIAAEIIAEYSPELSAAYDASRANGEMWQYPDVALLASTMSFLRAGAR